MILDDAVDERLIPANADVADVADVAAVGAATTPQAHASGSGPCPTKYYASQSKPPN